MQFKMAKSMLVLFSSLCSSPCLHAACEYTATLKQDGGSTSVIMKTVCHPGYHHYDLVVSHTLGFMMYVMYTEHPHSI